MDKELRILILEDVPKDAELMERELRKGGIAFVSKRVAIKEDFLKELKYFAPHIILADYKLPLFDGLSALAITKEQCPDIPFIFVSWTIGEDFAIETFKQGATDYILKDRLSRLVPAVLRAIREAELKEERKRAERALQQSERELKKRIAELEEFYNIAVGRELRMIELKEEIKSLKEELEKYKKESGNR